METLKPKWHFITDCTNIDAVMIFKDSVSPLRTKHYKTY
jgi:hypothetical protein